MTRVLPAQIIAAACVAGLAASDAVRVHAPAAAAAPVLACAGAVAAASRARLALAVAAAVVLAGGWWWGSLRLDALDRSPLAVRVGTAGRFVVTTVAEARPGRFDQRQFARLEGERVELELRSGRAPPQGARLSVLAVVKAPRGPSHGFDERTWLRRQGVHVVLRVDDWRIVVETGRS